jgi:hypothetical protein
MSYQERRAIVSLVSNILVLAAYSAYMFQRYPQGSPYAPEVFRFWGAYFLILIPVSIVARIIIEIVFHIVNAIATRDERVPITDERDRLIESKAQTSASWVFIVGFILAMGSLAFDQPPTVMFIVLLGAGLLSEVVSEISRFFFYRRGF